VGSLPILIFRERLQHCGILGGEDVVDGGHGCKVLVASLQRGALREHGEHVADADVGVEGHGHSQLRRLEYLMRRCILGLVSDVVCVNANVREGALQPDFLVYILTLQETLEDGK